jgi:hypothetical protein
LRTAANPADLRIEQPTLIEMSIKEDCQALGIAVPDVLSARADRVIE